MKPTQHPPRPGDGAAGTPSHQGHRGFWSARLAVLALVIVGFSLHSVLHVAPSIVALLGAGTDVVGHQRRCRRRCSRRWSGRRWCSSWACSRWSRGLVHTGVIGWLGDLAVVAFGDNFFAAATGAALRFGDPRRLHRQHSLHRHDDAGRRGDGARRPPTPRPAARCGGRSRSAPASPATAPRSRPAPTWWPSVSRRGRATRSASGSSPATASW